MSLIERYQQYEKDSPYLPYTYAVIGNITLVVMQTCMKVVSESLSPFFALYVRGICLLVISTVVIRGGGLEVGQK